MTFTEAAVEVLRLVGRPLHYKKITEIAIAKNLLSHVGKAPDMTMSSRLATMIKKDRGEEPIVKVKPGVFALREFDEKVMALADEAFDVDIDALPDVEPKTNGEAEAAEDEAAARQKLPGAEVFPEEEDDDEPILAKIADEKGQRSRKGKKSDKSDKSAEAADGGDEGGSGRSRRRRRKRRGRSGDSGGGKEERGSRRREREKVDMSRAPEEGDLLGRELADAIYGALESQPRKPVTHARAAELLISKGRLAGSPASLAPTVAAAVRADGLRRGALGARFRQVDGLLALTEWYLPKSVAKHEREAREAAEKQRSRVHRAFLRKLEDLPAAGFAELVATWLNAEGVGSLRAVRRPGSSGVELHLAGTLRRGQEEVHVALLVLRDGKDLDAQRIVEIRGALHHYGNASAAWVVTTGRVGKKAREEVEVAGAPPCVLYDGDALAEAMESRGVGLCSVSVPLAAIDLSLLDALRGEPESLDEDADEDDDEGRSRRRGGKKRRKRKDRSRDDEESKDEERADGEETSDDEGEGDDDAGDEGEEGSDEESSRSGKRKRRRRRRGGRRRRGDDASDSDDSDDTDDSEDAEGSGRGASEKEAPKGRGARDDGGASEEEAPKGRGSQDDEAGADDERGKRSRRRRKPDEERAAKSGDEDGSEAGRPRSRKRRGEGGDDGADDGDGSAAERRASGGEDGEGGSRSDGDAGDAGDDDEGRGRRGRSRRGSRSRRRTADAEATPEAEASSGDEAKPDDGGSSDRREPAAE
jgi:hypothetical protein